MANPLESSVILLSMTFALSLDNTAMADLSSDDPTVNPMLVVDPSKLQRWTNSGLFTANPTILVSGEIGPQTDGAIEIINAIELDIDKNTFGDTVDKAFFVRLEQTDGDIQQKLAAQNLGGMVDAYLSVTHKATEVATAAIGDMHYGQDLHGKWQGALVLKYVDGTYQVYNLGATSLEISKDGFYAIQKGQQVLMVAQNDIGFLTAGPQKVDAKLAEGLTLPEKDVSYYLVRSPINVDTQVAFTVIEAGALNAKMWFFNGDYEVVNFISVENGDFAGVIPTIDATGTRTGTVTRVTGRGDSWTTEIGLNPSKVFVTKPEIAEIYQAVA